MHLSGMFSKLSIGAVGTACLIAITPATAYLASGQQGGNLTPGKGQDATSAPSGDDKQPPNFRYTHLWTSKDGETHISECEMKGFILKSFAEKGAKQYVKQSKVKPEKISFSQLPEGTFSDLHSPPGVQWVVDMQGSWFVETSDGTRREFSPGEVMFQDNVENSPAAKQPQHKSGTNGKEPCNQMIMQVERKPEVDNPCPF
jgi:hypothetical protein